MKCHDIPSASPAYTSPPNPFPVGLKGEGPWNDARYPGPEFAQYSNSVGTCGGMDKGKGGEVSGAAVK